MAESTSVHKQTRALRWYAALTTVISAVALLGAAKALQQSATFDAVTVHRINLVDNDGTLRLVIANRQNFPPPLIRGKPLDPKQRSVGDQAVFMFYNRTAANRAGFAGMERTTRRVAIRSQHYHWINWNRTTTWFSPTGSAVASITLDCSDRNSRKPHR